MKLSRKDREALGQAILSHVRGAILFAHKGIYPADNYLSIWAERVRDDVMTPGETAALRYIICLPYTQPDAPEAMKAFLYACWVANGCSHRFETCTTSYALTRILELLER